MTSPDQIRADIDSRMNRFASLEAVLTANRMDKRAALFAALIVAASDLEGESSALARRISDRAAELKDLKSARGLTSAQTRPAIAAALLTAGRPAEALGEAKEALPASRYGGLSGLRPQAAMILAVAKDQHDAALFDRVEAIIEASPRRWYGSKAIGPIPALSLALQGLDGAAALGRFQAAYDGLTEAGMGGSPATTYAPKVALFDPNPAKLAENFRSLREGRRQDRRLKLLTDVRRALLSAAAPDPATLHAALEPALSMAWTRRRTLSSTVASALASSLALSALGRQDSSRSVQDLMSLIAAEQAAVIAATTAATSAAVSSGS